MNDNDNNNNNMNGNIYEMKKLIRGSSYKNTYISNDSKYTKSKLIREDLEKSKIVRKNSCCDFCAISISLLFGFMFLIFGLLTTYFPLYELIKIENLKFNQLQIGYHLWKNPIPEVLLKVYIFNITNSEDFIAGRDKKLKVQEIGPIIFQEILQHKDVEFHDENSTLSYTVSRRIVFKESANEEGIMNRTVNVVNMALSAASYVSNSFLLRQSYKILLNSFKTKPIVTTTIYNYLFNLTDPVLEVTHTFVPFIAPTKDTGILLNMYRNVTDRVNVNIGSKHGFEKFFTINTWNDRPTVPRFYTEYGECNASLKGSTEGAIYTKLSTRDSVFWYWRKSLCRPVPLYYESDYTMYNLKGYKFSLRYDVFDRPKNSEVDCYAGNNLPNGLSDLSKCYYDQQVAASFPHFCNRTGPWDDYIEGLSPNMSIHESYTILEPVYGVPMRQKAVSQCNAVLYDLKSFKSDFARFSNMVIPMFWLEIYQDGLEAITIRLLQFSVNFLPKYQFWISGLLIILGLSLLMIGYHRLRKCERRKGIYLVTQKN